MPAWQFGTGTLFRADVVGNYAPKTTDVCHVGLVNDIEFEVSAGCELAVMQMGPPMAIAPPDIMTATVGGRILTEEERVFVDDWLADMATRTSDVTYIAHPASSLITDAVSKRPIGFRFSCAGFVQFCYRDAVGVHLVAEDVLPDVDRDTVVHVWSHVIPSNWSDAVVNRALRSFGVQGGGPWPLLLPGYLIHALALEREDLPLMAVVEQISFPR